MVKPPIVLIAGLLRARGKGVNVDSWAWISDMAGQRPFRPPNVAGWDDERWLDTSSWRGRWFAASYITSQDDLKPDEYTRNETASEAVDKALSYWGNPVISAATRNELEAFGKAVEEEIEGDWHERTYRGLRQNALRMMIPMSPEMQTC